MVKQFLKTFKYSFLEIAMKMNKVFLIICTAEQRIVKMGNWHSSHSNEVFQKVWENISLEKPAREEQRKEKSYSKGLLHSVTWNLNEPPNSQPCQVQIK